LAGYGANIGIVKISINTVKSGVDKCVPYLQSHQVRCHTNMEVKEFSIPVSSHEARLGVYNNKTKNKYRFV
jgi:hypothetical protein